ncbi:response regulator [Cellulosimicrobium protaetiae]|uniref:Response regulator transcription factor n=1 Tax=Cellulosimicrobium protaetiae TaxID=2587808 RepID=A0A6M5UG63_9MICO|nr:response regulator transcription factor [Cellulosimicrobium protaetiae]QJW37607.1 response regulator transcription factor [Cellulosimicrobium protaetiae]
MSPAGNGVVRVLVVDDHPVVRSGIIGMLAAEPDLEVVAEAGDGEQAVALARDLSPDVVLMDLRMPVLDGVGATAALVGAPGRGAGRGTTPAPRVVVLTTYETDADILRAVEAGATGYLLKDTPRDELVAGVRAAARGQTVLAPSVATRLVTSVRGTERLTDREIEVLRLVARGLSNAAVGQELFIAEATVKTHLLRAFAKLGVDDRTAAVTVAMQRGFLPGA